MKESSAHTHEEKKLYVRSIKAGASTHLDSDQKHGKVASSALTQSILLGQDMPGKGDQVGRRGLDIGTESSLGSGHIW